MLIRELELRGFMSHDETRVELPETGVVVVTGSNGAGKSALLEGVAWGLWGKTVRGAYPWRPSGSCSARVKVPTTGVVRKRTGKRVELHVEPLDGTPAVVFETPTKAQEALELRVGDFERWRRTSVFTATDAWTFTAATDGQRKLLLEALLGLEVFDQGLARCRADLRAAEAEDQAATVVQVQGRARLEGLVRELGSVSEVFGPEGEPPEGLRATAARVESMVAAARKDADALGARRDALVRELGACTVHSAGVEARLSKLRGATCPTCGQTILPETREALRGEEAAEAARVDALRARLMEELSGVDAALADVNAEGRALVERGSKLGAELRALESVAALRARDALRVEKLRGELDVLEREVQAAEARKAVALHRVAVLSTAEGVLGLRGVRAQVLDGALRAVESMANLWLGRIAGGGLRLVLTSTVERKTGGAVDAIGLDVEGAGGGQGYAGASAGERRRIDVALLLALAEVAQAASGGERGTVWFDEVFDVLDPAGVEAVSSALVELGRERPVVVVTHSTALLRHLTAARELHVDAGRVVWRG